MLDVYLLLSQNNINPNSLTLSEAIILSEEIICRKIRESLYQLLPHRNYDNKASKETVEDRLTGLVTSHKPKGCTKKILTAKDVINGLVYSAALSELLDLTQDIYNKLIKK